MFDKLVGKIVVIRSNGAGVHYGELVSVGDRVVVLRDARRIWYWHGAFTLSGIAKYGCDSQSKLSERVDNIAIFDVLEIIEMTDHAAMVLDEVATYEI